MYTAKVRTLILTLASLFMNIKLSIILTCLFFLLSQNAVALMPPHITKISNIKDEVLNSKTLILEGYSLSYLDLKEIKITNSKTKKELSFVKDDLNCKQEGKDGGPPGSIQYRCTLKLKIENLEAKEKYQIDVDGFKKLFYYLNKP